VAYKQYLNSTKKEELRGEIVARSEAAKAVYITNTPGKIFEYYQKATETVLWQNGESDPAKLPIMATTANMIGLPIATIGALWADKVAEWQQAGARISALYDLYMGGLEAAQFTSQVEVDAFMASVVFDG